MSEPGLTYPESSPFPGRITRSYLDSEPASREAAKAPEGAPNVVIILLDDLGFAQLGSFGGLGGRIRTPHLDQLAKSGVSYSNFHVTPMCSPTRAALLTGRNPHTVGVGSIMEIGTGFPGYDGRLLKSTAMIPAILSENGYVTGAFGKWHLVPPKEQGPAGPMDRWPLRQGFDRFYGFMALADHYATSLWEDNRHLGVPTGDSYHFTEDLIDHAIEWVGEIQAAAPERPFFQYIAPSAMHAPHQVERVWSDKYRGMFSAGWDVIRHETLDHQIRMGIVPDGTELPERNPGIPAWSSLSAEERRLLERQMEVYAGFLEHTDEHIGRYLSALKERGILDDTLILVMSDNGASAEGGTFGESDTNGRLNGSPETLVDKIAAIDRWGERGTSPLYAAGWAMAGNTPNRWFKKFAHEGGTRAPLILHWPGSIPADGIVRRQFHYVTDVLPTILELTGCAMPPRVRGYEQEPLEGSSFGYTLTEPTSPSRKDIQYVEMLGHRAIWHGGLKAVTAHFPAAKGPPGVQTVPSGDFDDDIWELYDLDADFSESRDLASSRSQELRQLIDLWWVEAERYHVLPLDDRFTERYRANKKVGGNRRQYVYFDRLTLPAVSSPNLRDCDHVIVAEVSVGEAGITGAIVSDGAATGGYVLGLVEGRVTFGTSWLGEIASVQLPAGLAPGDHVISVTFMQDAGSSEGGGTYLVQSGLQMAPLTVRGRNRVRYDSTTEGIRIGQDCNGVIRELGSPAIFGGRIHRVEITREVGASPPELDEEQLLQNAISDQ